jgi:pimeloyl-ACP methyl ester carboxylesterase
LGAPVQRDVAVMLGRRAKQMPKYEWRNIDVHFERSGAGSPVLMLHAMSVSGTSWRKVIGALKGKYDLIVPDLPFHGQSGELDDPAQHRHDDNAEMLRLLVEANFCGRVHVVGHSFGGASALAFALKNPDLVDRAVLLEPSVPMVLLEAGETELMADFLELGEKFDRYIENGEPQLAWQIYIDSQNGPGAWLAMPDDKRQRILATTNQAYAAGKAIKHNDLRLDELRSLRCRTIMVAGEQTPARHRRTAEIVCNHIPGCVMTRIPGANHMSPTSHPAEVASIIDHHFC